MTISSPSSTKKLVILIIICAFLIHGLLGLLLFLLEPRYNDFQSMPAQIILMPQERLNAPLPQESTSLATLAHNSAPRPEEWGEMLARQSNFGNPLGTTMPQEGTTERPQSPQEKRVLEESTPLSEADTLSNKNTLPEKSLPTSEDATLPNTSTPPASETMLNNLEEQNSTEKSLSKVCPKESLAQAAPRPTSLAYMHEASAFKNSPSQNTTLTAKNRLSHEKLSQEKLSQKHSAQGLTLASIGKGFLEQTKHNGDYDVTMLGKKGGAINADQIKIERYVAKLSWCLQNSFKHLRNTIDPYLAAEESEIQVYLQLSRAGIIQRLEVIKSSGNTVLDQHTLAVFKDAGSAFPPVPTYIKASPFAITYHIEYGATQNTAPLSFSLMH